MISGTESTSTANFKNRLIGKASCSRRRGALRAKRSAQKGNDEPGHEQAGGKRDRDSQRKGRLDETGGNIKKRGQAINDGEHRGQAAQARRCRVRGWHEPPVRRSR